MIFHYNNSLQLAGIKLCQDFGALAIPVKSITMKKTVMNECECVWVCVCIVRLSES